MSLKAIKELADAVENMSAEFRLTERGAAARAEIAALEKAAITVAVCGIAYPCGSTSPTGAQWHDATVLLATIAKEAK